jgi:hypothetical protein
LGLVPAAACGAGDAVAHGVPVLVNDGDLPAGDGGAGRRGGEVAGQGGVERAEQPAVPGACGAVLQGGQRDGHLGQRRTWRLGVFRSALSAWAVVAFVVRALRAWVAAAGGHAAVVAVKSLVVTAAARPA